MIEKSQQHPIILPVINKVTKLIFRYEYEKVIYGGSQAMLYSIHLKYWLLNG